MTVKRHATNVLMDDDTHEKLKKLAQRLGRSRGGVIRILIDYMYSMDMDGVPTCASGQSCYIPHMHPKNPTPLPTAPPTSEQTQPASEKP